MSIVIEGGQVASVEVADGAGPPPDAIDLTGRTVLPGLIDAHCHFMSDLDRSPGFGPPPHRHGEAPRPRELGYFILAASAQAIVRSGFTTIRDVGSYDDEALATAKAIDLGIIPGPADLQLRPHHQRHRPGGSDFRHHVP